MSQASISVIVPTFNAAAHIADCLDSVLQQRHTNLEVWVLDGGSKDETLAILARYAVADPRVNWVSEPDLGIYDAMNKGIAKARSQWLYFMGADDRMHDPDSLARIAPHLVGDRDLVYGNVFNMHRQAEVGKVFDLDLLMEQTICHQAIFYRRDLLSRVGNYELAFKVCGDWDLNLRCFVLGARTAYAPVRVCKYAGNGFSSVTVDYAFLDCKLQRVSRFAERPLWHAMFRSRRFEFQHLAHAALAKGHYSAAVGWKLLHLWHSVMVRVPLGRARQARPA